MRVIRIRWVSAVAALCYAACAAVAADASRGSIDLYAALANQKFIDLTHTFVHAGLRTIDQIPLQQMVLPLVVIDVHDKVAKNPDYTLKVEDINSWETRHGRIPERAFVAMRTDWSKRWPDDAAMQNKDAKGTAHYPGWSKEVLKLLYEDRKITASGHETTDTDPGLATTHDDYSLESYILGLNHYQIEMLANLDQVPEAGALVIVTWPKALGGTGFPARVMAVVP